MILFMTSCININFLVNSYRNHRFMKFSSVCLLIIGFYCSSCKRPHEKAPEVTVEKIETVNEDVVNIIQNQIEQFKVDSLLIIDSDTMITGPWISSLFSNNNFQPIWTDKSMATNTGDSLINFIENIEYFGLSSSDYHLKQIKHKVNSFYNQSDSNINITRIYEVNILLTEAFFKLGIHLNRGIQDQVTFHKTWKATSKDSTLVNLLETAVKSNRISQSLQSQEPKYEQYTKIKFILSILLDKIDRSDSLHEIENNLDSVNSKVVRLNSNIERWRWESMQEESQAILINIPSNTFQYYINDSVAIKSKVITGKPETPTPFNFDSKVSHFFIYPYWNVPYTIATKEILPKLKLDSAYLTSANFDVLDRRNNLVDQSTINWKKYSETYFPFRLRQRDGTENTLGVLKFMFSNPYAIYLHDTNSRTLFSKENRWLSHGCVRLEKAREFAQMICKTSAMEFNIDSLNMYLDIKSRKKVNINPLIPIHIRYYSIEVESNNAIYYNDIYQIDKKMNDSLRINEGAMEKDITSAPF